MSKSDKKQTGKNHPRYYAVVSAPYSGKHFQRKPNRHGKAPHKPVYNPAENNT